VPLLTLCSRQPWTVLLGTCAATATFVVFYLMTVFSLSWAISAFGYTRGDFLILQMLGVLFFALTIPVSAAVADRYGRYRTLIAATGGIMLYGLAFGRLFGPGGAAGMLLFLSLGFALMGLTYGPLGTALTELYPTAVRYTGASLSFNLAGILGASLAPYIATRLASRYGVAAAGYYLTSAGLLTLLALLALAVRSRRSAGPLSSAGA
jgi:MFS family permease